MDFRYNDRSSVKQYIRVPQWRQGGSLDTYLHNRSQSRHNHSSVPSLAGTTSNMQKTINRIKQQSSIESRLCNSKTSLLPSVSNPIPIHQFASQSNTQSSQQQSRFPTIHWQERETRSLKNRIDLRSVIKQSQSSRQLPLDPNQIKQQTIRIIQSKNKLLQQQFQDTSSFQEEFLRRIGHKDQANNWAITAMKQSGDKRDDSESSLSSIKSDEDPDHDKQKKWQKKLTQQLIGNLNSYPKPSTKIINNSLDKAVRERGAQFCFSAAEKQKWTDANALPQNRSTAEIIESLIAKEISDTNQSEREPKDKQRSGSMERFNELRDIMMRAGPFYRDLISDDLKEILADYKVELPQTSSFAHERREYDAIMINNYKESQRYRRALVFKEEFAKVLTPLQLMKKRKAIGLNKPVKDRRELHQEAILKLEEPEANIVRDERRELTLDELYDEMKVLQQTEKLKMTKQQSDQNLIEHHVMTMSKYSQEILQKILDDQVQQSLANAERRSSFRQNLARNMIGRLSKLAQKVKDKNKVGKDVASAVRKVAERLPGDEPDAETEIFYSDKLKHTFYGALKSQALPCSDELLNQQYETSCLLESHVYGIPTMTHITKEGLLSLTGYALNSGVCQALGQFLGQNTAKHTPYLVKSLVLADNRVTDADLAHVLKGLLAQQHLQHFFYGQNIIGMESLRVLKQIVESQKNPLQRNRACLQSFRLNAAPHAKVQITDADEKNECSSAIAKQLFYLFENVLRQTTDLRSLRLSKTKIGNEQVLVSKIVEVLPELNRMTFLDLSESLLSAKPLGLLLKALPKSLRSLVLSGNPMSGKAIQSAKLLQTFDEYCTDAETALTLLDMSHCFLDVASINKMFESLMKLPSILSVNFSGSDISNKQLRQILDENGCQDCKIPQHDDIEERELVLSIDQYSGQAVEGLVFNGKKLSVMDVVHSQNFKEFGHLGQMLQYRDQSGTGSLHNLPLISQTQFLLNRYQSAKWEIVPKCFIANKWRYCLVFYDPTVEVNDQQYFQKVCSSDQNLIEKLARTADISEKESSPVLLGGFTQERATLMVKAQAYVSGLDLRISGQDFQIQYGSVPLKLRQELYQKLEFVGYKKPCLINVPDIDSEYNEVQLEWELSKFHVFGAFVPPGRHSIIIRSPGKDDFLVRNMIVYPSAQDYSDSVIL